MSSAGSCRFLFQIRVQADLVLGAGRRSHPRFAHDAELAAGGEQTEEAETKRQKQTRPLRRDASAAPPRWVGFKTPQIIFSTDTDALNSYFL